MKPLLLSSLLMLLFSSFTLAQDHEKGLDTNQVISIKWDCYLDGDRPVSCNSLQNNIDELSAFEVILDKERETDLILKIEKRLIDSNITAVIVTVTNPKTARQNSGFFREVDLLALDDSELKEKLENNEEKEEIEVEITNSMDRVIALSFLTTQINDMLQYHLKTVSVIENELGQLEKISGSTIAGPTKAKNREKEKSSFTDNLYIQPSLGGSYSKANGALNSNLRLGNSIVYSLPKWKLRGRGNFNNQVSRTQTTNFIAGNETKVQRTSYAFVGLRTIGKKGRINLALITRYDSANSSFSYEDPTLNSELTPEERNNKAQYFEGKLGLEWILIPFNNGGDKGNVYFRWRLGPKIHDYIDPSTLTPKQYALFQHGLKVGVSKHFEAFDVGAYAAFDTNVLEPSQFYKGSVGGKVNYRISKRTTLNASASAEMFDSKNFIANPASTGRSFNTLSSGNKDPFAFWFNFGLNINLFNASLPFQDFRWEN